MIIIIKIANDKIHCIFIYLEPKQPITVSRQNLCKVNCNISKITEQFIPVLWPCSLLFISPLHKLYLQYAMHPYA